MSVQSAKTAVPRQAKARAPVVQAKAEAQPGLDYTVDRAQVIDLFPQHAVDALGRAVQRGTPHAVPQADRLAAHFDASLAEFSAVWSTEIGVLLDALGAEAAVLGDRLALRSRDVSFATLLHEAAHLLQVANGGVAPVAVSEAEADARMQTAGRVETGAAADVPLLRDTKAAEDEPTEHEAAQDFRKETKVAPETAPDPVAKTPEPEASETPAEGAVPSAVEAATPLPGIVSELPPLSPEAEAAKAALEQSVAALTAATTPEAYMAAFTAAVPSAKAAKAPTLEADLAALADQENTAHLETTPDFAAKLHADEAAVPDAPPVAPPVGEVAPLEQGTPAPVPDPVIAPTAPVTPFVGNAYLDQWKPAAEVLAASDVAQAVGKVQTADSVDTSPGPAPKVVLEGEADPARADAQAVAAAGDAAGHRDRAMAAVVAGKGPEQVALVALDQAIPMEMTPAPVLIAATAPVEGADAFLTRGLDAETTAIFDAHHAAPMQASLAETDAQMTSMVTERDTQRDAATTKAESDMAAAETTANADQARVVGDARKGIQDQRQATLDSQQAAVADVTAKAELEGKATKAQIAERVRVDEGKVKVEFAGAEVKAKAKVTEAETKAAAEKKAAEKAAENDSWWDRAVDWVGDQLSKLADIIGKIFDAVRAGIGAILDAVKSVAFAIIDAAAGFIKGAIALYGAALKLAVSTLIGGIYPELADKLNGMIDKGVAFAQSAVDKVATGLKAAVSFVVDTYKKALNAILSFVQGALNTVLAIAKAALTGDWAEVARLILEPILGALGINKDDFYAYVGTAMAAIGKIIDDPLAFLGNLLDAVVSGFQKFGDNFKDHLIAGIVGWLTGAFAGVITMPAQFDLMGVLDIARQILGLTLDMIRKVAVRIIGEKAVAQIEFFIDYAATLIKGGWGAFFDRIKDDLSNLASMVMEQIATFLVERVVKAGIVWLASLINPAGALVKLVLMIWDFIMWLKDNLQRMIDIVNTIVQGMIDISNGVIEPAAKKVEGVLARMLPPAIDLLARLLGLGNVAEKVKDIITGIHKRIEDAIVALIQKVLAKFTGKGGAAADPKDPAAATGGLMAPVTFGTAAESHTLYAEEHGADVVPMMRSTPMAVETWLMGLKTEAGVKAQLIKNTPAVTDATVTDRTKEITPLIVVALSNESKMDADSEGAQDAVQKTPAQSADEKAKLDASAKVVAKALTDILKKLGLTDGGDFGVTFKTNIDATFPGAKLGLGGAIKSRINADLVKKVAYSDLKWDAVMTSLPGDTAVLTQAWIQPFHAGGILRDDKGFVDAIIAAAKAYADGNKATLGNPDTSGFLLVDTTQKAFMTDHFLPATNSSSRTHALALALAPDAGWGGYAGVLATEIAAAVTGYFVAPDKKWPDMAYKDTIKAASFREGGLFEKKDFIALRLPYYEKQDTQGQGIPGTERGAFGLDWFINKTSGSPNFQENVNHTSDMVRDAKPGFHEWIPVSQANEAIAATISQFNAKPDTKGLEGIANFVYFLHHVRTETSSVIFDPKFVVMSGNIKETDFISKKHFSLLETASPTDSGFDEKMALAYENQPAFRQKAPVLQGHEGGLYFATLAADGRTIGETQSSASSQPWHKTLGAKVSAALQAAGPLKEESINALGKVALDTFEETTLSEETEASLLRIGAEKIGFPKYRIGSEKMSDFDELIRVAVEKHTTAAAELHQKIKDVIAYTGGIPT